MDTATRAGARQAVYLSSSWYQQERLPHTVLITKGFYMEKFKQRNIELLFIIFITNILNYYETEKKIRSAVDLLCLLSDCDKITIQDLVTKVIGQTQGFKYNRLECISVMLKIETPIRQITKTLHCSNTDVYDVKKPGLLTKVLVYTNPFQYDNVIRFLQSYNKFKGML